MTAAAFQNRIAAFDAEPDGGDPTAVRAVVRRWFGKALLFDSTRAELLGTAKIERQRYKPGRLAFAPETDRLERLYLTRHHRFILVVDAKRRTARLLSARRARRWLSIHPPAFVVLAGMWPDHFLPA